MKLFFKRKAVFISVIIIFIGWGLFAANEYKSWWDENNYAYDYYINQCNNEYKNIEKYNEWCNQIIESGKPVKPDTITVFFDLLGNYSLRYLQIVAPLFIIAMAIWNFHKDLKSENYKNIITRMDYKKYIKKNLVNSLKCSLFLPIFLIYVFILAYILSGHFDIKATMTAYPGYLLIDSKYLDYFSTFIFVYICNLIFHSIFWINIGYILTKKGKNIIVTLVSSFLCYIAIFIISELFIGGFLLSKLFGIKNAMDYLNLANIWVYSDVENIFILLFYGMFLVVISFSFLLLTYKNKEGVVIENEK